MSPTELQLPAIQRRLLEVVQQHPNLSPGELRSRVWADPREPKDLHIAVSRLNRLLAPLKLEVCSRGGQYKVRAVS
jgi:hypothetical protein